MSTKSTGRTRKPRKSKTPEGQRTLPFQKPAQSRKSDKRSDDAPMNQYPMSGITVEFPFKPYPAQIQMMSKIVKALKDKQNALLESPTGSGKSLAILCASLAWAGHEKKRLTEEAEEYQAKEAEVKSRVLQEIIEIADDVDTEQAAVPQTEEAKVKNRIMQEIIEIADDMDTEQFSTRTESTAQNVTQKRPVYDNANDDDDFRPVQLPRKLIKTNGLRSKSSSPAPEVSIDQGNDAEQPQQAPKEPQIYIRAPKIYIGSRTHKQLSQLVGELRRNTRHRPKMSVLGSRDQYCIHARVRMATDKSEACFQNLDDNECVYARNVGRILGNRAIQSGGQLEVWDIEDLTQVGRQVTGCPYFAARSLSETAEIIFCPYNYILDPIVRSSMSIDLTDSVVILDEAHNVEDIARSSASFEVTEVELQIVSKEMSKTLDHRRTHHHTDLKTAYSTLFLFVTRILEWMTSDPEESTMQRDDYEEHNKVWSNHDLLAILQNFHIKKETLKGIEAAYDIVEKDIAKLRLGDKEKREGVDIDLPDEERDDISEIPGIGHFRDEIRKQTRTSISMKSLRVLEGFIMVFRFIIPSEGPSREKDYSMALIRRVYRKKKWDWEIKLAFWCLNPAIAFRDMADKVRSVILTSGTLSPLDTFASELETPFPIRLEANHVIDKSQVWIRSIMKGPMRVQLHGTWERASQFQYQDDIGESLFQISETIPYGILCFIPSYNSMDKLLERWRSTGLYDRLLKRKHIIREPSGSKELFEELLEKYYYYISEAENNQEGDDGKNGAILFAVYRGKVSEGIDFTNNNCRAVVALGIPFPNIKDIQVELKREYNTKRYKAGEPVLNGGGWYQIQAYRAINQALGRCIRHRRDWGAIILLESRFCEQQNVLQLSKWVRPLCAIEPDYKRAMEGLGEFVAQRNEHERLEREKEVERVKQELELERLALVEVKVEPVSPPEISNTNSPDHTL